MTKSEKVALVEALSEKIRQNPKFYIIDMGGFSAAKDHKFRSKCFEAQLKVQGVKNTLIRKSLEAAAQEDDDFEPLYEALKQSSHIIFVEENANLPAKVIKKFREDHDKPLMKAAYIEKTPFVGDENLEQLVNLKSKSDLIGEIVSLLQSPPKNVISALQSSGQKLAGILKTLSEREG